MSWQNLAPAAARHSSQTLKQVPNNLETIYLEFNSFSCIVNEGEENNLKEKNVGH